MRHLILGTAGHVDHGKTELVRALTGTDTDRLKEEKERGISIELGFAPFRLDDDLFLGIVDVPGHERFVKQMVAGAGGIDLALLLVAADESVMPQTEEHMEVLQSLAVGGGLVVVSKCDLAPADMIEIVREDIAALTKGTFLEGAPVVETSSKTGAGIDDLKRTLVELAGTVPERGAGGPYRQPVDRVFHKKGIGVVITGSCYSGTVRVGDKLELLPRGLTTRVRELQSFNEKRTEGHAGERLAVALQGLKLEEVFRGDMLVTPKRFSATHAIDARVKLASYHDFVVKNRERLRIHHGAREVLGRVIVLEHDSLQAGDDALVQLKLEKPLVTAAGDSFVLRKYSPARVIGGGTVIDPDPQRHKRRDAGVIEQLTLKERGDPVEVQHREIEQAGLTGVSTGDVDGGILETLVEDGVVTVVEKTAYASESLDRLAERVEELTGAHQARFALHWGMDKEELRQKSRFPHGTPMFNAVLEVLTTMRPLFVRGNRVRSGAEELVLSENDARDLDDLARTILNAGVMFPSRTSLEEGWRSPHRFADAVQHLKDRGEIVEVGNGLIHHKSIDACVETLRGLFDKSREITVADVKNALGLTRKHTIPLLEFFDDNRVTSRSGNNRVKGPRFPS
jgi:selenocysteine-specific elongation factor